MAVDQGLGAGQFLACLGFLMLVHARQHDDLILFDCVKQRVGEAAQDGTANFVPIARVTSAAAAGL